MVQVQISAICNMEDPDRSGQALRDIKLAAGMWKDV